MIGHQTLQLAAVLSLATAQFAGADFTGWIVERVDREGLVRFDVWATFDDPLDEIALLLYLTLAEGSPVFHHRDVLTQGADSTVVGSWDPNFVLAPDAMDSYLMLGGGTGLASGNLTFAGVEWGLPGWHVPQIPFGDYLTGPSILVAHQNGQGFVGKDGRVQVGSFVVSPADAEAGAIVYAKIGHRDQPFLNILHRQTQFCLGGPCAIPDCNANGLIDGADIAFGMADSDGDDQPDDCERQRGDLNLDNATNGADLAMLLDAWGPGSGVADINDDLFVNGADLAILLSNWGEH